MPTGTAKKGPYIDYERILDFEDLANFRRHPSGIMTAKKEIVVDLELLDRSVRQGLRLQKGIIYEIDFLQVMNSNPKLNKAELWVFYLPTDVNLVTRG